MRFSTNIENKQKKHKLKKPMSTNFKHITDDLSVRQIIVGWSPKKRQNLKKRRTAVLLVIAPNNQRLHKTIFSFRENVCNFQTFKEPKRHI